MYTCQHQCLASDTLGAEFATKGLSQVSLMLPSFPDR